MVTFAIELSVAEIEAIKIRSECLLSGIVGSSIKTDDPIIGALIYQYEDLEKALKPVFERYYEMNGVPVESE